MKGKNDYILIPIALMVYAFQKKIMNPFRTFIYLKTICSGHFTISPGFIRNHSSILAINPKTFRNHLNQLVSIGWITINGKRKSYRLIGFVQLARRYELQSAKGAIFYFTDIDRFKEFCVAAVTKYLIHWVRRGRFRSGLNRESPSKNRKRPSYPNLPERYLSKVLGLSKSTVSSYYHLAEEANYMKITPQFQETLIPISQFEMFKKHGYDNPDSLRKSWNTLLLQRPHKIHVDIFLRRKDNLRKTCLKNREEKFRTYNRE